MWYNYVYLDPRKPGKYTYENINLCFLFEPIYLGKGKDKRYLEHFKNFKNNNKKLNSILKHKFEKIQSLGLEPIIEKIYFTNNETDAYNNETISIQAIGTIDGETVKRGPLCNFCLDNRPPNHSGKTYEEIYGIEQAKIQKELRTAHQVSVGGYFKGHQHTNNSKEKISAKVKGKNNPRYGAIISSEMRNKISIANKGRKSSRSIDHIFIAPNGFIYKVNGSDLKIFCVEFNISLSTLDKRINTGNSPVYGKTKGWTKFSIISNNIQETEIISYTTGAFKQDTDDMDFGEFDI